MVQNEKMPLLIDGEGAMRVTHYVEGLCNFRKFYLNSSNSPKRYEMLQHCYWTADKRSVEKFLTSTAHI